MKVAVVKNILDANDRIAEENKRLFDQNKLFVLNLMSSPGAGKTTLLEELGKALSDKFQIGVVEGDIQSSLDAERVAEAGLAAVQIFFGKRHTEKFGNRRDPFLNRYLCHIFCRFYAQDRDSPLTRGFHLLQAGEQHEDSSD